MAKAYIGTSGWQYAHWRGNFYPENLPQKDWLRYYAKYFDSVEVNSSFYRQTWASTFKKWQEETPLGFVFAVKGNRFITHIKRLKDCEEPLKIFFTAASPLGEGKHLILWQLPPSLKQDIQRLETFLELLPQDFRHAFEFRHASWVDREVFTILQRRNIVEATVVFQDWKDWPRTTDYADLGDGLDGLVKKLPFVYLRFHGNKILYSSDYTDKELKVWAEKIGNWLKQGKDVYAYFNNDALGFAVPNAQRLSQLVEK